MTVLLVLLLMEKRTEQPKTDQTNDEVPLLLNFNILTFLLVGHGTDQKMVMH